MTPYINAAIETEFKLLNNIAQKLDVSATQGKAYADSEAI